MNLATMLQATAEATPDHPALVFEGRVRSYAALWGATGAVAARLRAAGIAPGDRVALCLPNVPAFAAALHGVLRLGAIAVPLNPSLTPNETLALLDDAGARAVLCLADATLDPRLLAADRSLISLSEAIFDAPERDEAPLAVGPDTPAAIVFSSGTTGQPKGVTLSHGNIVSNVQVNAAEVGMTPADRALLFMPLFHCYGLNVILNSALSVGATVVLERRFDPHESVRTIARERVTMFFGVPTTFIVLLQSDARAALASLRYCYCAAAPLPLEIEARWQAEIGCVVNQAYGLSEASPCVAYNAVDAYRPGSIGLPSAGVEVQVVDPNSGQVLGTGEVGELRVKGPGVMLGYWGRPEATAEVLRDGWLRTGDLGWRDADGYLFITDRLKDLINCGGMKVFPTEVEDALYRHPAVAEVAVVGVPDSTMGEVVHAQVAPRPGHALEAGALRAFLADHLACYKRPTLIRIVDALPKGRTGKSLRRVVRAEEAQRARRAGVAADWSRRALQDWIVAWLEAELTIDGRIAPDQAFVDVGVSSLLAVRQAEALSTLLGRDVPATITWLHPTPERLAAYLVADDGPPQRPSRDLAPVTRLAAPMTVAALSEDEAEAALLAELAALEQ